MSISCTNVGEGALDWGKGVWSWRPLPLNLAGHLQTFIRGGGKEIERALYSSPGQE